MTPCPPRSPITPEHVLNLSSSTTAPFMSCPRRAQYAQVYQREPSRNRAALSAGVAIHSALESRARGNDPAAQLLVLATVYPTDIDPLEWRTAGYAEQLLKNYNAHYLLDDLEPHTLADGTIAVELPVSADICDVPYDATDPLGAYHESVRVVYHGVLDAIVKRSDGLWVLDHKTSSTIGSNYFDQFRNSQQQIGYVWLAQHLLQAPIAGTIIDVLGWRKPSAKGVPFQFERQAIRYDPTVVSAWRDNTALIAADFLANLRRNEFPMHSEHCVHRYGRCEYFDVCELPPEHRLAYLGSPLFRDNPPTTQAQRRAAALGANTSAEFGPTMNPSMVP